MKRSGRPRRSNGKRSFRINVARIVAGRAANYGRAPLTPQEALATWQWLVKRAIAWRRIVGEDAGNVYDLLNPGSGINHSKFPGVCLADPGRLMDRLSLIFGRLLLPPGQSERLKRFLREGLGISALEQELTVDVRMPADWPFMPFQNTLGMKLRVSPNQYHSGAVWLKNASLHLDKAASRWSLYIGYSYRHDDGWGIGIDQMPGESLEKFGDRAWYWLDGLIAWRQSDDYYNRFLCGARGAKMEEMKWISGAEVRMREFSNCIRKVFRWGRNCPGFFDNDLADMVTQESGCGNDVFLPEMTGRRLATVKRWIREDRKEREEKERLKNKKGGRRE